MARKSKPMPHAAVVREPGANGAAAEVFTLPEAAAYLRVTEDEVVKLAASRQLPGRLIGGQWRFLKSAIQHWLGAGTPAWKSRKDAQLALAGKYKNDPDLKRICEEAYRQRVRR
jgi:excisionase family DNA binding protein